MAYLYLLCLINLYRKYYDFYWNPFLTPSDLWLRYFWSSFSAIDGIWNSFGIVKEISSSSSAIDIFSNALNDEIRERAFQLGNNLVKLGSENLLIPSWKNPHLLDKGKFRFQLLQASESFISIESNPVIQFMFLFNKAISSYGNLLMHSLGFEGLISYSLQVVERLGTTFKEQGNIGYRIPQTFNPEDGYDNYFFGCIDSLIHLYSSIIYDFSKTMENLQRNIVSEKLNLVVEEVKYNMKNEDIKTLIMVENPTVGLILADLINKKIDKNSNKRRILAKFHYTSNITEPLIDDNLNSKTQTPQQSLSQYEFDLKITKCLSKPLVLQGRFVYDLNLYYCFLKDIMNETLLISSSQNTYSPTSTAQSEILMK